MTDMRELEKFPEFSCLQRKPCDSKDSRTQRRVIGAAGRQVFRGNLQSSFARTRISLFRAGPNRPGPAAMGRCYAKPGRGAAHTPPTNWPPACA